MLHTVAGDRPAAEDAYREAIRIAEDWKNEDSGREAWYHLGQAHSHLGMELWDAGRATESLPHFRAAQGAFRRALELEPADVDTLQASAWFLNLFQDPRYRDPQLALGCARRLVALAPEPDHNRRSYAFGKRSLFTLGLAEYRMGHLDAAREALERSIGLRRGGDAYEWFVLAMVMARQGDMKRAHQLCGQAVRWMRKFRYSDFELHALDAESAELLGRLKPPTGLADRPMTRGAEARDAASRP